MLCSIDGINYVFFFFSSRRRHTRLTCDWSSDVCSSDLHRESARREMQIAQEYIVGRALEMREGFFDGGDAIHLQTLGGEAFIETHTDAFFVVKYEDGPVLEKFGGRANGF